MQIEKANGNLTQKQKRKFYFLFYLKEANLNCCKVQTMKETLLKIIKTFDLQ